MRAGAGLESRAAPAAAGGTISLCAGVRIRLRRRHHAEPDALRVPGAVAQGAVARRARATRTRRRLRQEGLAFGAGVIVTFVALAAALLAFRAAGEQLGWGFQLQSPAVVTALAILFFVLALNLSGVFEFATLVPSSAAGWTRTQPVRQRLACPASSRWSSRRRARRPSWARRWVLRSRSRRAHVARVRRARSRHGLAARAARVVSRAGVACLPRPAPGWNA